MTTKWVYTLDEIDEAEAAVDGDWDQVRGLLGGKGANLGEMNRLGVPVPPGFTITTEACNTYLACGGRASARAMGAGAGRAPDDGGGNRETVWRSHEPAPGVVPIGRQVLDAGA